ncbi:MAG: SoxR reducing system RseC family protein [Tangfeifania sp.]
MTKTIIKHKALVKEATPNSLVVSIMNPSACASCHAKGACTISDVQEKEIDIIPTGKNYSPGQEITVLLKETQGFKALFYGYVLPFLLVLFTLIITSSVTGKEGLSGLLALGILIPYYITLYFFRDNLKKVFKFEVEEIS